MFEKLIHFWRTNVDLKSGNYIAKDDQPFLKKYNLIPPHSFAEFVRSDFYGKKKSSEVHSGLLPRPYGGDIENATIYFLMGNPGVGSWDYFDEENEDYRKESIQNLHQEDLKKTDYPFLPLNPLYSWTGAGRYWNRKLSPLIEDVIGKRGGNYRNAASFISKKFCVFELFPYHSKSFGIKNKDLKILPS